MDEKNENKKGIKKAAQAAGTWIKGHKAASIIILLILLALIGLLIFLRVRSAGQKVEAGDETVAVERRDLEQSLTLSGSVESGAAYSVTSKLTDVEVKQVYVKLGDTVKKGDIIAVLDDTELKENVSSAQKSLSSAERKNSQDISSAKRTLRNAEEDRSVQTGRTSNDVSNATAKYDEAANKASKLRRQLPAAKSKRDAAAIEKQRKEDAAESVHNDIKECQERIDADTLRIKELEEEIVILEPDDPDIPVLRKEYKKAWDDRVEAEGKLRTLKGDQKLKDEAEAEAAYKKAQSEYSSLSKQVKAAEEKETAAREAMDKAVQTNEDAQRTTSRTVEEQSESLSNAYNSASDNLDAPKKELRKAQKDLDASKVVAEADGIVTAVNVKPGDKYKGDAIAVVQDDSSYRVSATADQYDISSLAVGQQAGITINAADMNDTDGRLIYVGSTPMVSETGQVGTTGGNTSAGGSTGGSGANYRVEAVIQEPSKKMRIGMTAKVVVTVWKKKDCLAVPDEAVRTDENGEQYVVVVNDRGKKRNVKVEYGMKTDYYSEISGKGIEEGVKVLVSGDDTVDDDIDETEE